MNQPLSTSTREFIPSPQQAQVFEWIEADSGNATIVAVAGSGKTTTLVQGMKRMRGTVAFAAYNKKIADEIELQLERMTITHAKAATFHSYGFGAWRKSNRRVRVWGKKNWDLLDEVECPKQYRQFCDKAASLAKQYGFGADGFPAISDRTAWDDLIVHFDLDQLIRGRNNENGYEDSDAMSEAQETDIEAALAITMRILELALERAWSVVDFDDMIWCPLVENSRFDQYDWVLIDEAQDSNPVRREIARRMLKPGGRLIAVGDPAQAIYGFTGANSDALEIIRAQFNAIELPLTVSYRCPKSVVAVAQQWVSHIQAHESAPDGKVESWYRDDLMNASPELVNEHAAVLCRNTAPLIELCYYFLKRDIRCHVEGKEIGEQLVKLATMFKARNLHGLRVKLEDHRDKELARLLGKKQEERAGRLDDSIECLFFMIDGMPAGASPADLVTKIRSLFEDTESGSKKGGLTLSTIHKSKGREWDRVFWFASERYQPSKYARQDWQLGQEKNLMYVAATRSKSELYMVSDATRNQ